MSDTGASMQDDEVKVKSRRIRKEDWTKIEKFVQGEFDKRSGSRFRKKHEEKWCEVDRQLTMEPMRRVTEAGEPLPVSWNASFELGELSKASEVISADVRRIVFPQDRLWLEAHVELPQPAGQPADPKKQKQADGVLRSLMTQQHIDFGFKARIDLSVKEALHHGSFVAEVDWTEQMMVWEGSKIKLVGAPVWIPHSMWNCFPDESPSVEPTSMFYSGSMIIRKYQPLYKVKQNKGAGWMPAQYGKIKKQEHKNLEVDTSDVQLLVYYGDISIERTDGDIYLPNSKVILANGTIVYYNPGDLPFASVIYGGYERQDPRDPYHTSPLIKQSPTQKIATICANKFIDGVSLQTEPPIVYDGNDPYMVQNDGPRIEPGAKTPTKGSTDFKVIEVGDPNYALAGMKMAIDQMQEGLGVNSVRSGAMASNRTTATEIQKVSQGGEVRTIDFISKLDANLRTFLYMQHELNKLKCENYSFYCTELDTPDFIRIEKKDIPQNVHFDVIGSKGVLGEEQRAARTASVVGFASGNPLFAPLLDAPAILSEMLQDAGNKNPERLIKQGQDETQQLGQKLQQAMVQMQQMGQALQKCQQDLQQANLKLQDKSQKDQIAGAVAQQDMQQEQLANEQRMVLDRAAALQRMEQERQAFMQEVAQAQEAARMELEQQRIEFAQEREQQQRAFEARLQQERELAKVEVAAKRKKTKIKKTSEGYEVEEV